MKTFHIRAPMPRGSSNAFYREGEPRIPKTLCGEPVTDHDIRFGWQAFAIGNFEPCAACVEVRENPRND